MSDLIWLLPPHSSAPTDAIPGRHERQATWSRNSVTYLPGGFALSLQAYTRHRIQTETTTTNQGNVPIHGRVVAP
jgi:hypothetical protein